MIVSFIARITMPNKRSYLRSNILYIKWKYDMTKINIHKCINILHQNRQPNAARVSLIYMLKELTVTGDGFKVIPKS